MGFEPTTASLEGWNSTTELRPPFLAFLVQCSSNRKPFLTCIRLADLQVSRPASPHINLNLRVLSRRQEQHDWLRVEQVHEKPDHWRCLTGSPTHKLAGTSEAWFGGQARIRTLEDISQQIYSLPPLAAWVPARDVSLLYTNQIAAQVEDTLSDQPLNKDK